MSLILVVNLGWEPERKVLRQKCVTYWRWRSKSNQPWLIAQTGRREEGYGRQFGLYTSLRKSSFLLGKQAETSLLRNKIWQRGKLQKTGFASCEGKKRSPPVIYCGSVIMPRKYGETTNFSCLWKSRRARSSWTCLKIYRGVSTFGLDCCNKSLRSAGAFGKIEMTFRWAEKAR